jgi:hypothetical protein
MMRIAIVTVLLGLTIWFFVLWTTLGRGFLGYFVIAAQKEWSLGIVDGAIQVTRFDVSAVSKRKAGWSNGHRERRSQEMGEGAWLPSLSIYGNGEWFLFPLWVVAVLPGTVMGVWGFLSRRRVARLRAQGRCACGYSLQGLVSDRCPECGTKLHEESILRT